MRCGRNFGVCGFGFCCSVLCEEGEALAEACEGRGVSAVLAILGAEEQDSVRRPGLKALARLASESHETRLEIGVRLQ